MTPYLFFRFLVVSVLLCVASESFAGKCDPAGEFCTYHFTLLMSKDDKVCQHMDGVYNWSFTRMFDYRGFTSKQAMGIESTYPTSEEFEAVPWQYPKISTDDGKVFHSLPVAVFDINNDGKKEIVIKAGLNDGSYDSYEYLLSYQDGEFDLNRQTSRTELFQGQNGKGKPLSIDDGAAILRPFILNGVSYLSSYHYSRRTEPPGRGRVNQPPQTMWVKKYKGGGSKEQPLLLENICEFNMIRVN